VKTVAVVPVKSLQETKSRLAVALSPEERASLTLAMLNHVLSTIRESGVISSIGIISPNSKELSLPDDIAVIEQTRSGLNNHLEEGREWAISNGADALMIIFSDMPLLTPEDIKAITNLGRTEGTVVLAPDRHGGGTNIMLSHPASLSVFAFGQGSYHKHRGQTLAEGCRIETYISEGTSLDIDTPEDLSFWHAAIREERNVKREA
jgi:2-phospho-L-lactate guanylyltransferase